MRYEVSTILVGTVAPLAGTEHLSGIDKHPLSGPVWLGTEGLHGDAQADRRYHGGPDKALHHYAQEHYAVWQQELDALQCDTGIRRRHEVWSRPGAFGENIATTGCTEHDICIGDVFSFGGAVLEVSQARQPCWKLDLRFDQPGMARLVQQSGRTGWYYRVRQCGLVCPGDVLVLQERPYPEWSLARIVEVLYHRALDVALLHQLLAISVFPPSWRAMFENRVSSGQIEDWSRRLEQ